MMWYEKTEMYRCRWGGCRYELTGEAITDAGYRIDNPGHVVFVNEQDFEKETSDDTH